MKIGKKEPNLPICTNASYFVIEIPTLMIRFGTQIWHVSKQIEKNKFNVMFSHFQGASIPQWDFYIRFIPIYRMDPK